MYIYLNVVAVSKSIVSITSYILQMYGTASFAVCLTVTDAKASGMKHASLSLWNKNNTNS